MPTWPELVITLVALVLLALLLSDKGERIWASVIAVFTWVLVEFSIVAVAFIGAWRGLVE